jgi:transcriptional regulator with GAF, ATPase, and Fis domain
MTDDIARIVRLQGRINDLTSLMALPAMWAGCEPREVLTTLLDVTVGMLHLDFVYAALGSSAEEGRFQVLRIAPRDGGRHSPPEVARTLEPWLDPDAPSSARDVPNPVGAGVLATTRFWLGLDPSAGVVVAGSRRPDFPSGIETLLLRVAVNHAVVQIQEAALRAARKRADEMERAKNQLQAENIYLREERDVDRHGDEIIGQSEPLRKVLELIAQVAPTDACVLIEGETGTGKELVARAIHRASGRKDAAFVKLNCAAIPTGLLESELFGHEKGAFTGAVARKVGRFELADGGTIFLDEVGEIPLELQAKLLRVLQEHEFERLGGTRTIHVAARLVAASNRDLAQMVDRHEFRSDLYYRLKVFPIVVPPLRERRDDIPSLVRWFTDRHSQRSGKTIGNVPGETMNALIRYRWPGNVREMENLIERSVILSRGPTLEVPLGDLQPVTAPVVETPGSGDAATLEEVERQHIRWALDESRWIIAGPFGAAAKLGMKRTSLQYKMQKLGISRER